MGDVSESSARLRTAERLARCAHNRPLLITQPEDFAMRTRITDMLGIQYPIVQGGMHFVGLAELASAVSNAGGLGMITALTLGTSTADVSYHQV